jgi:predicted lipase
MNNVARLFVIAYSTITNVTLLYGAKTDTFGYVAYDKTHNQVIVSFRGSVSLANWIENIKFWKADKPFDNVTDAKVATGFYESYATVAAATQQAVRVYVLTLLSLPLFMFVSMLLTHANNSALSANPSATLVITGHSLGGALASLAAFDLKQITGITSKEVYTFGSPRVGDSGFASAYQQRVNTTWRMTNHKDIVPHLPPKGFNFFHGMGCDHSFVDDFFTIVHGIDIRLLIAK